MALHEGTSFLVGKVDFMDLYPLTFQEFLCALGEERFVNILQGTDTDMVTTFKSKYIDRLREYYYVGGMSEVVQTYVETKDFNQVRADTEEPVELLSTGFFKTRRDFIGSKTESCMEFDSDAAGEEK